MTGFQKFSHMAKKKKKKLSLVLVLLLIISVTLKKSCDAICAVIGGLVILGFNGPLREYFSLYRAVSQREEERKEKR